MDIALEQIIEWMSKNYSKVLEDLEISYEQNQVIYNGISKVMQSVLDNPSEKNLRKQLYVTMKSLTKLSTINRQQILINMVLVSGKSFFNNPADLPDNFKDLFGNFK